MKLVTIATLLIAIFAFSNLSTVADESPASAAATTIHMKASLYQPDSTSVPVGTTVTFVNDDPMAHTVTASDQSFDSKDIVAGKSWQMTFKKPGTYTYGCIYHPGMKGQITVLPSK